MQYSAMPRGECIFCQIVKGELPSRVVMESETCMAFLDISPAGKGHTLVVPRQHYVDLFDIDPEVLGEVMKMSKEVGIFLDEKLSAEGSSLFQMNRSVGGQTIFHFHIHIVPRWQNDALVDPWIETPASDDLLSGVFHELMDGK